MLNNVKGFFYLKVQYVNKVVFDSVLIVKIDLVDYVIKFSHFCLMVPEVSLQSEERGRLRTLDGAAC